MLAKDRPSITTPKSQVSAADSLSLFLSHLPTRLGLAVVELEAAQHKKEAEEVEGVEGVGEEGELGLWFC